MPGPVPRNEDMRSTLSEVRKELLDFGLRNPLLNYRPLKSRGLTIAQVSPAEVFSSLVTEGRELPFLPVELNPVPSTPQRDRAIANSSRTALVGRMGQRTQDKLTGLPTSHSDEEIDDRLLATYYAAKSSIDEQGVNTLYFVLGFLSWSEPEAPQDFHRAPLILIPVELERKSASEGFTAKYDGNDILPNVCLLEFMKLSYGIEIESYSEVEDLDVAGYFRKVQKAVSRQTGWSVDSDAIAVGFFSFAKFLMYRDLDPDTWENEDALLQHDVLNRLLGRKFFAGDSSPYGDGDFVDDHLEKNKIQTVVDADSTQSLALLDVAAGTNVVIQGPPGTGKSQTIVNVVAQALAAGKKVLFVSEKKAALDVVKQRLDRVGLGPACLELHSNKVKKKTVIEELKRTSGIRQNGTHNGAQHLAALQESKAKLDEYCKAVNSTPGKAKETIRDLYGILLPILTALKDVPIPDVKMPGCLAWTDMDTDRKRRKLRQLQDCLNACGIPREHPFWGARVRVVLPATTDGIRRACLLAVTACQDLLTAVNKLAQLLNQKSPESESDLTAFLATIERVVRAPALQGVDVGRERWLKETETIKRVLSAGERLSRLRKDWEPTIQSAAWSEDVKPLKAVLSELQNKWWRLFSPRWRNAKRQVAGLINGELPMATSDILAIPEAIRSASELSSELTQNEGLMAGLFGPYWKKAGSDWALLKQQFDWIYSAHKNISTGQIAAWCISQECLEADREQSEKGLSACGGLRSERQSALDRIKDLLDLDAGTDCQIVRALSGLPLSEAARFWSDLATRTGELEQLVRYLHARDECVAEGLTPLTDLSEFWARAQHHLLQIFDYARVSELLTQAFNSSPVLAQFDGAGHDGWVEAFKGSDSQLLQSTRASIAAQHLGSIPRSTSANGQLGVLLREFEKKARHLAVRQLMLKAGNAIQALKPVFMMSPLSVANFLPPGTVEFDLVVFDEASQVKPSDALGAIVRGKQSVVVGDSKQLPPTSFFDTMVVGDDLTEEDDGTATSDIESVLGLFCTRGAHQRMLRWHYRSRHESLITGSNHLFYDDKLVVFPSPDNHREHVGLIYRRVPDGVYDRSKTRTNRVEAGTIATAVMQHASEQMRLPRGQWQTLGVVALSKAQMDAILNEVELLRRKTPACEEFFSDTDEQFFVKNLETVQGDERDVIFISIGYARTVEGYLSMGFGPVNRAGGERRLNVLFSRARRRCEVFTSLSSADIDVSRNESLGLSSLKTFLHYAEHGQLDVPVYTGGIPQSPFEEEVLHGLQRLGYTVHSQVGSAGFYLDLAIVDPLRPGHYVLGIECDGAAYHSARSTRDRDRLRQAVLVSMGWTIHRIWSTSWFRNPEGELQALQSAIKAALARENDVLIPAEFQPSKTVEAVGGGNVPLPEPVKESSVFVDKQTVKYRFASLQIDLASTELRAIAQPQLSAWLSQVVMVESPIHWLEAARRVASAAGVQRVGNRIQDAFWYACTWGSRKKLFILKGEFLWSADGVGPVIRDRSEFPPQWKKLEYVAPEEIHAAIESAINESFGLKDEYIATSACRLLGFARVTEEMRALVDRQRDHLTEQGRLVKRGEVLVCNGAMTSS
jgi:hypothetical protein